LYERAGYARSFWRSDLAGKELGDFLRQCCKERFVHTEPFFHPLPLSFEGVDTIRRVKERRSLSYTINSPSLIKGGG